MTNKVFFPLAMAPIVIGAIGSSIVFALPTLSQLMVAVVVISVMASIAAVVRVAVRRVSAPPQSSIVIRHCPLTWQAARTEIESGKRKPIEEINRWDAEHIAGGYVGG